MQHLIYDTKDIDDDMQYAIFDFGAREWSEWGNLGLVITTVDDNAMVPLEFHHNSLTLKNYLTKHPNLKVIYSAPVITEQYIINNFPELRI